MFSRGSFVVRLIGILLLVGLMISGGYMAYNAGVTQGVAQSPEVAEAYSSAAESGQSLPVPGYDYRFGYPGYRMRPHFGFFPFGSIFGFFLFICLFFGLMRMIFRPRWGWHYGHHGRGPWKGHGHPWGVPPWACEDEEGEYETDAEKKKDK